MNEIGFIFGAVYIASGIIMGILAPKLGPNLFIGFRIGYTYADREIWNKANKLVGFLISVIGAAMMILSFVSNLGDEFYILMAVTGSATTLAIGYIYSKRLAEMKLGFIPPREKEVKPIKPFRLTNLEKGILFATVSLFFIITYMIYSLGKPVPTSIDINGNIIKTAKPSDFLITMLTIGTIMLAFLGVFLILGYRYPIILHAGVLSKKWGRDIVFKFVVYMIMVQFTGVDVFLLVTYINLAYGYNIGYTSFFIWAVLALSFSPIIWAIYRRIKFGRS